MLWQPDKQRHNTSQTVNSWQKTGWERYFRWDCFSQNLKLITLTLCTNLLLHLCEKPTDLTNSYSTKSPWWLILIIQAKTVRSISHLKCTGKNYKDQGMEFSYEMYMLKHAHAFFLYRFFTCYSTRVLHYQVLHRTHAL